MNTTRHGFSQAKRRSRRFRGSVSAGGVSRERNFALSGLNVLGKFIRRVALRLPYADQFRAFGAWWNIRSFLSSALSVWFGFRPFPRAFTLGARTDFCPFPCAVRFGVGDSGCFRPEGAAFPRALLSVIGIRKNFGSGWTVFPSALPLVVGALVGFSPKGAKLVSVGQAKRSPTYSENKFGTLKECNWKEVV